MLRLVVPAFEGEVRDSIKVHHAILELSRLIRNTINEVIVVGAAIDFND